MAPILFYKTVRLTGFFAMCNKKLLMISSGCTFKYVKVHNPFAALGRLFGLRCVLLRTLLPAVLLCDRIAPEAVKHHHLYELLRSFFSFFFYFFPFLKRLGSCKKNHTSFPFTSKFKNKIVPSERGILLSSVLRGGSKSSLLFQQPQSFLLCQL